MDPIGLNELASYIHLNRTIFEWRSNDSVPELCANIRSETMKMVKKHDSEDWESEAEISYLEDRPSGIPIDVGQIIILALDYCAEKGINIEQAIDDIIAYDNSRNIQK